MIRAVLKVRRFDAVELDMVRREMAEADARMPTEQRDLLGDDAKLKRDAERRREGVRTARLDASHSRRVLQLSGYCPMRHLAELACELHKTGKLVEAANAAAELLPFMYPRLAMVHMNGAAALGAGGGTMRFTWEPAERAPDVILAT